MPTAAASGPLRWLLDSNIISEPVRLRPHRGVVETLLERRAELALPVTVLQELHFGWLVMPEGRNKRHIGDYLQAAVPRIPVLGLDAATARVQADVRAQAARSGRPIGYADSEIAAIAIAHGLTLVTRNTRDFEDRPGLQLANWFEG